MALLQDYNIETQQILVEIVMIAMLGQYIYSKDLSSNKTMKMKIELVEKKSRNDIQYWSKNLSLLLRKQTREIYIKAHPKIKVSDEHTDEEYFTAEGLGCLIVDQIANFHLTEDGGEKARRNLQQMLELHQQKNQYNFFLYKILTRDSLVCLEAQTMFADWINYLCEQQKSKNSSQIIDGEVVNYSNVL